MLMPIIFGHGVEWVKSHLQEILTTFLVITGGAFMVFLVVLTPINTYKADDEKCHKAYGIQWDHQSIEDPKDRNNQIVACVNTENPAETKPIK